MKKIILLLLGITIAIIPFIRDKIKFILRSVIMAIGNLIMSFK